MKIYSEVGDRHDGQALSAATYYIPQRDEGENPVTTVPCRGLERPSWWLRTNRNVRNFAVETLRELNYHVLDAPNGAARLRILDAHPEIVLLLTDVGLPGGMNGRQLADEASGEGRT